MADEYDAFIKAAQQAIKAQGAEHKQQFNNYLAEYNQTASTPVRDETDKYKVNTGSKGGFGTNYIAQSGVANGAGKGKPPRPSSGKPTFDESWAEADNFLRTTDIPKDMDADIVKSTANYNDLLDQYRKGAVSAEEFKAETGMFPEEWDQQKGRYTTISENQRYAGWKRPDEDVNLLEPQMRDANMNPNGLRSDYNYAAADAAIQAQQKGMAQDQRYKDLMARYNSSKPEVEPNLYDEPAGPPAPTATQNYGNYYDGRSGGYMPEENMDKKTTEFGVPQNEMSQRLLGEYEEKTKGQINNPDLTTATAVSDYKTLDNQAFFDKYGMNKYRYEELYGDAIRTGGTQAPITYPDEYTRPNNYGYYYDGRSGNSYPYTRYDEPVGPPAPSVDQNSPVGTYQQNQNAGVSGFTGNPQTNPEAAALLQEYDNRMAAHNSQQVAPTVPQEINPEFERRIADAQKYMPLEVLAQQVQNQPEFYSYIMRKIAEQRR